MSHEYVDYRDRDDFELVDDESSKKDERYNFLNTIFNANKGDVKILLKDDEEYNAISYILEKRSDAFKNKTEIDLKEFSIIASKKFLYYLYTFDDKDFTDLTEIKYFFELLQLSDSYNLKNYKLKIKEEIMKRINQTNTSVFEILLLSFEHKKLCSEILTECIDFLHNISIQNKCFDKRDAKACGKSDVFCCKHRSSNKNKTAEYYERNRPCIYFTSKNLPLVNNCFVDFCCEHRKKIGVDLSKIYELPETIKDKLLMIQNEDIEVSKIVW